MGSVGRLALAGLILSVAVLVIVISVVNGFERELRARVLALLPHVTVTLPQALPADELAALSAGDIEGAIGLAPFIERMVLLAAGDELVSASAVGVQPERYGQVSDIGRFTGSGDLATLKAGEFGVILGAGVAAALGVAPGDNVRMILPAAGVSAIGTVPRQRRMVVVDIFDSESILDDQQVYVHLATGQRLFRSVAPEGLHVRLSDLFALGPTVDAAYERFGERTRVNTWTQRYGPLYQAIAVQKLTMFVLLSFLIAVAAFNLISGLVMIVEQRKQDVAVLATLGFDSRGLMLLFVTLGSAIALSGILSGVLGGALVASALPHLFSGVTNQFNLDLMSQYFIAYLPVDVRLSDLATISSVAFVLALLATVFPAYRATRILPSRVLAHE